MVLVDTESAKTIANLKEKLEQKENAIAELESSQQFSKNKLRESDRQIEIECNNSRIIQEQYNNLKNM